SSVCGPSPLTSCVAALTPCVARVTALSISANVSESMIMSVPLWGPTPRSRVGKLLSHQIIVYRQKPPDVNHDRLQAPLCAKSDEGGLSPCPVRRSPFRLVSVALLC